MTDRHSEDGIANDPPGVAAELVVPTFNDADLLENLSDVEDDDDDAAGAKKDDAAGAEDDEFLDPIGTTVIDSSLIQNTLAPPNPLSSTEVMNDARKPYESYAKLCPYFAHEKAAFKEVVDTLVWQHYLQLQTDLHDAIEVSARPNWLTIRKTILAEMTKDRSFLSLRLVDTAGWTPTEFIARFVHEIRGVLFEGESSPYRHLPFDKLFKLDRSYAIMRLFDTVLANNANNKKKKEKKEKKRGGKAATVTDVEDEGEPVTAADDALSLPVHAEPPALTAKLGSRIRLKTVKKSAPLLPAEHTVPQADKDRAEMIKAQPLASVKHFERQLPARWHRKVQGNDVEENPLKHWFVRNDKEGKTARLIGAGHLNGIDRNASVDWEDGGRIDRKNCSPAALLQLQESEQALTGEEIANNTGVAVGAEHPELLILPSLVLPSRERPVEAAPSLPSGKQPKKSKPAETASPLPPGKPAKKSNVAKEPATKDASSKRQSTTAKKVCGVL